MNIKLSFRSMFLLWFGAAISMAEIMTGTLYAPMGFKNGLLAILLGHISGGMSFGQGVELAVVMPLSWLPLVSDYTRMADSEIMP